MNSESSSSFDLSSLGNQPDPLTWDLSYPPLQNVDQDTQQIATPENKTDTTTYSESEKSKTTKATSGKKKLSCIYIPSGSECCAVD